MTNRFLAYVGIGLYVLQVLSTVTDANGTPEAPDFLILISGTASAIYVVVAAIALWKRRAKRTALALPIITFLSMSAFYLQTPSPSDSNLAVNILQVARLFAYFYAVYLLFCDGKGHGMDEERDSEVVLSKDRDWQPYDGQLFKVISFLPLAYLDKNRKVQRHSPGLPPLAVLHLESHEPVAESGKLSRQRTERHFRAYIFHREDFRHLWLACKERGVASNEEAIIIWTRENYTHSFVRYFSAFLPKLLIMICRNGTYAEWHPTWIALLRSEGPRVFKTGRGILSPILSEWKPVIMP